MDNDFWKDVDDMLLYADAFERSVMDNKGNLSNKDVKEVLIKLWTLTRTLRILRSSPNEDD